MKEKYFLKTQFLYELSKLMRVWIYVFDPCDSIIFNAGQNAGILKLYFAAGTVQKNLRLMCSENNPIALYEEKDAFLFGGCLDENGYLYVCGPVTLNKETNGFLFHQILGISSQGSEISYKSIGEITSCLRIMYLGVTDKTVSDFEPEARNDIEKINADLTDYTYKQSQEEKERYGRKMEEQYIEIVEKGSLEEYYAYSRNVEADALDKMGDFAKNSRKKVEYMFVTALTLTRRAAVRGGMGYLEACDLSDVYLRKLENCRNDMEIIALNERMEKDFIIRVNKLHKNKDRNYYVERCKEMIIRGITRPFKRQEIAKELGLSPDYLSALFKEQEGISMMQFYQNCRLEMSSNLLKYSDYSIVDISERFHFSSSSSFAKMFKDKYGMTPLKYRKATKMEQYIGGTVTDSDWN